MKDDLNYIQDVIGSWGEHTFGNNLQAQLAHLKDEVIELEKAINDDSNVAEEVADCTMMLLHMMHTIDKPLTKAIWEKFMICLKRKWGPPDSRGVIRHI